MQKLSSVGILALLALAGCKSEVPSTTSSSNNSTSGEAQTPIAGTPKMLINGCKIDLSRYRKDDKTSGSFSWLAGFDVENRQGYGQPMKKQDINGGESYIGEYDLDKDGTKLEVSVSSSQYPNTLTVQAALKKISGNMVEYAALGTSSATVNLTDHPSALITSVEIKNPLIASILQSDKSLNSPVDSDVFPKGKDVFSHIKVSCEASFK